MPAFTLAYDFSFDSADPTEIDMDVAFQTSPPAINGLYYFVIRNNIGLGYRADTGTFEPWNDADMPLYSLVMMEQGVTGFYVGGFPPGIPAGTYWVVAYKQLGIVPAASDTPQADGSVEWPDDDDESTTTTLVASTNDCATKGATPRTGNLLSQLSYDAINTFVVDMGEPLIYTAFEQVPVTYQSLIYREVPTSIMGFTGASAYRHEIMVPNDPCGLYGPATINKGKDTVIMTNKTARGATAESFVVLEILQNDEGMWHLSVGAK